MIILVDPVYNPEFQSEINSATKLAPGVTIAKFLGAYGDRTSFNHVTSNDKRKQIARNLYLQAEAMRIINGNTENFNDIRLIVSEGIYDLKDVDKGNNLMEAKSDGRLVFYQVVDREGKIDLERTFDVAEYWKDYINFETLYLDYDTFNVDKSVTGQIGLEFKNAPATFDMNFSKNVETWFNNSLMSAKELVEIKERD